MLALPAIMTSVERMMPSGSEWRQPYTLSNLDLVTLSFTLIAGNSRLPAACRCVHGAFQRRLTSA